MQHCRWLILAGPLAGSLAACGPRYEPPAWLQGDWTSRRAEMDTAWFEWTFTATEVRRRDINGLLTTNEVDYAALGYREDASVEEGAYALISALGADTRDTFFRTADPEEVVWLAESPFFVFDSGTVIRPAAPTPSASVSPSDR